MLIIFLLQRSLGRSHDYHFSWRKEEIINARKLCKVIQLLKKEPGLTLEYPHPFLSFSGPWWQFLFMSMAPVLGSDCWPGRQSARKERQRAPPMWLINEENWYLPWKPTNHNPSRNFNGWEEGIKCKQIRTFELMAKVTGHPLLLPLDIC